MGRPAASVGAAAGRVSVWRRDSGARHGFTVAKRIPATCMVVVRGLRPSHSEIITNWNDGRSHSEIISL